MSKVVIKANPPKSGQMCPVHGYSVEDEAGNHIGNVVRVDIFLDINYCFPYLTIKKADGTEETFTITNLAVEARNAENNH